MTKLISPAPFGWANLPFNSAKRPYSIFRRHKGCDWGWYEQRPGRPANIVVTSRRVVAPIDGTITHIADGYVTGKTQNQGWGNYVEITVSRRVKVRLCHFMKGALAHLKVGQKVKAGYYLAQMGNSGETNGQIHLHEELWIDGKHVDPAKYRGPNGKHLPGTEPAPKPAATTPKPTPVPTPAIPVIPEEEEDLMRVTVHFRNEGPPSGPSATRSCRAPLGRRLEAGRLPRHHRPGRGEGRVPDLQERCRRL